MPLPLHWIALLAAFVLAFALARMLLSARAAKAPPLPRSRLSLDEGAAPGAAGAPLFRLGRLSLSDAREERQP